MNSNIGLNGIESIRIDGKPIGDLPLGLGHEAKDGLAEFIRTDKESKKNSIIAKYPKQTAEYLNSAILECQTNIARIKNFKNELRNKIVEYRKLLKDCDYRDAEMAKYCKDNPDHKEAMKELRLKYPAYDRDAMNQQIVQFEEGIERSNDVIEQDYNSIAEIKEILALVKQRDRELANIQ